jgi:hypothetical protein
MEGAYFSPALPLSYRAPWVNPNMNINMNMNMNSNLTGGGGGGVSDMAMALTMNGPKSFVFFLSIHCFVFVCFFLPSNPCALSSDISQRQSQFRSLLSTVTLEKPTRTDICLHIHTCLCTSLLRSFVSYASPRMCMYACAHLLHSSSAHCDPALRRSAQVLCLVRRRRVCGWTHRGQFSQRCPSPTCGVCPSSPFFLHFSCSFFFFFCSIVMFSEPGITCTLHRVVSAVCPRPSKC